MSESKRYVFLSPVVVIALLALTACIPQYISNKLIAPTATVTPTPTPMPTRPPVAPALGVDALAALEGRLEQIYDRVSPSVVNIQVVQRVTAASAVPEIPGFPFVPSVPQEQGGLGSGFVWDKQGHIVTNNHVVAEADEITVVFADGTRVPGTVVGTDPDSDLAVVKVDLPADRLQPVEVADSKQVKVGQLAIAIGNPFGLQGTMTVGIVSALGRYLPVQSSSQGPSYTIPDIIQTDAPINPGNSGGVLVNDEGNVVGVTAAIESPVQANAGIGFAIPSVIVQKVVPVLIEQGHYDHPWLGISGLALLPELREAMKLDPDQQGILIADVTPDSPADKAGLRGSDRQIEIDGQPTRVGGDVIVAIDGQPVRDFEDLVAYLVRETNVGQAVTLTVLRNDKEEAIQVELAARPKQEVQRSQPENAGTGGAWLGIQGLTLTPEIAQAMDLAADQTGVLVEQVVQGSPAHAAGIRGSYKALVLNGQRVLIGGDVITAVDGQAVAEVRDLAALMQQAEPGQTANLDVLRDGKRIEVPVKLAERPTSFTVPG
jgi:S1-C subfamily serine protease